MTHRHKKTHGEPNEGEIAEGGFENIESPLNDLLDDVILGFVFFIVVEEAKGEGEAVEERGEDETQKVGGSPALENKMDP